MPILENENTVEYTDPEDRATTIGDIAGKMFETIDFVDEIQDEELSENETPNLDSADTTISTEDELLKKAQEMASKDPEAIARAMDTLIKDMEEEYILTSNELDIAKDNLSKFHKEIDLALQKGEPIPDNYMKTTEELVNNVKDQQTKLNNLESKLKHERESCLDYAQKTKDKAKSKNVPSKLFALIVEFTKKTIQLFTKGLADIGNMLHEKNQEFERGSKQAMRNVGDKAQTIYMKTQAKQQKLTLSFKLLYEKIVNKVKDISKDIQTKRTLHKEEVAEKKAARKIDSLTAKLERAAAKVKGLVPEEGKESLLKNAFYNYALDQARIRQAELIQAIRERYDTIPHLTYKREDAMIALHQTGEVTKETLKKVQKMPEKEKVSIIKNEFSTMSKDDVTKIHIGAIQALGAMAEKEGTIIKIDSEYYDKEYPLCARPEQLLADVPQSRSAELATLDSMLKFAESPLAQEVFLSNKEDALEKDDKTPDKAADSKSVPVNSLDATLNRAREAVATLNNMSHKNVEAPNINDSAHER